MDLGSVLFILYLSAVTAGLLVLLLVPFAKVTRLAVSDFSRTLFKFLISIVSLQVFNIFGTVVLILALEGVLQGDIVLTLFFFANILVVAENIIIGWFAYWAYKRTQRDKS